MSTQAKYGWAIGLIIAGIIGALPFRNASSPSDGSAERVARSSTDEQPTDNDPESKVVGESASQGVNNPKRLLSNSILLPEADTNTSDRIDTADDTKQLHVDPPADIVEQVPNRLNKSRLPIVNSQDISRGGNQQKMDDRPATRDPVTIPDTKTRREMPRDVGPYRMKKVPSSKFMPASQSSRDRIIANPGQSRKVVHYKLRDGDSLRSIAQRYLGDANRFEEILADNRHLLTNGEKFLPVGEYITIIIQ